MKQIALKKALIVLYFGKFNNYFPLWLKSCEYNADYEWLLYTDDRTTYDYPANVHVTYITFDEIKKKIQDLVDFPIALDSPYKLCDWKPAYGELFQNNLKGYDYWGYCDVDLIWGHLSDFYTDEILTEYDKISDAGHFTLYKNTPDMSTAYRTLNSEGCLDYRKVYSDSNNYAFDEWGKNKGINRILLNNGFKIFYKPIVFSDIRISTYGLYNTRNEYDLEERRIIESNKHKIVFEFDNGKLRQAALNSEDELTITEEAYLHLQKRPMIVKENVLSSNKFLVLPPNIFEVSTQEISKEFLLGLKENKIYWHYYAIRWSNLKRKMKKLIKGSD